MLKHTQAIIHAPPPERAVRSAVPDSVEPGFEAEAVLAAARHQALHVAFRNQQDWLEETEPNADQALSDGTLHADAPDPLPPRAYALQSPSVPPAALPTAPMRHYGRIDRADAGHGATLDLVITAADVEAKYEDGVHPGADKAPFAQHRIETAEKSHSGGLNNSLSEIFRALKRAWHTTTRHLQDRWRGDTEAGTRERADAPAPAAAAHAPRLLTFGTLGSAIGGMSNLFLLHGISAIPLVLSIFRWPAEQSHDSCKPPAPEQLPEWDIQARQTAMTGIALAGSGLYAGQVLSRHWDRLSTRGKAVATAGACLLIGVSGLLSYYDKTLTMGRMLAGFFDKYLEILVTNGWTTEVGAGVGDARTLTAWSVIITVCLFTVHMIRSGIFVGVDALLNQKWLSSSGEILMRAVGKVVAEVLAFGMLMPSTMALANAVFGTHFIVRPPARSIRQSALDTATRCLRAASGQDSRTRFLRDLARNMVRPLTKREFSTKFVALPNLGHTTVCSGGQANMSVDLWFRNAFGESLLETIKTGETLSHARRAADSAEHDHDGPNRIISLVGDYLRADALPSERVRDDDIAHADAGAPSGDPSYTISRPAARRRAVPAADGL
ncbi:hypothetical protein [Robbsia sp. KACC 23696]|uniref:hypothetical protein n=1 Tax=Robbsia sp. KACC 23696 TaxID=3149231 RepID=UPI00325A9952